MKKLFLYKNPIIIFIIVTLFTYAIIMSAWISDDSLISLTQIVNFHHGDGLVFNYGERVQAFTHPVWFFFLSLVTFVTGNYFYTIIFVSIFLSLMSILVILYYAYTYNNVPVTILGLGLLIFSKAFIDYSTSGLENPLSYFLFSIILYILLSYRQKSNKQLFILYILFALTFLNRMDYALILLPMVITLLTQHKKQNFKPLLLSGIIVGLWFVFSLFYFGYFLPNTFYAKLEAGYPTEEFLQRGLQYFQVQYQKDPITLGIITLGIIAGFAKKGIARATAIGLVFYLLYFLKSGGDFMQGRFFAVPAFISTFLIIYFLVKKKISLCPYLLLLLILYINSNATAPLFVGKEYNNKRFTMGVADERGFYFQDYGLISPNRKWPKIVSLNDERPKEVFVICGSLGATALSNRQHIHYVDNCALTDPLLSQLPAIQQNWRIGHQYRKIPTDYTYALLNNTSLHDTALNTFYQDIREATHGDLWKLKRLFAIYRINAKTYAVKKEQYTNPQIHLPKYSKQVSKKIFLKYFSMEPSYIVDSNQIPVTHNNGMQWNATGTKIFTLYGLAIKIKNGISTKFLNLGLDNNDEYLVIFFNKDKYVNYKIVSKAYGGGIRNRVIGMDGEVKIDKINIFPLNGDDYYSLGWMSYE